MSLSARRLAVWLGTCTFAVLLAVAGSARAQVTQTDALKTPLPQPVGPAELALVDESWAWNSKTLVNKDMAGLNLNPAVPYGQIYAPPMYPQFVTGDAITLQGLFKWRKETIDPIKDAKTGPGYFSAKCGFSGELLLMGGNCQVQFGWYNVLDPKTKTPPLASEVYPFITGLPREQLKCVEGDGMSPKLDGFCPLAWDNRHPYDLSIQRWIPKTFQSGDISKDPRYKGGYVAFAVIGDPQKCPQNKYSMYEHNQRNATGVPWVTTLIYQSTVDPGGFYMAFEDLPMPATDWKSQGCDGDFNDFVFFVNGLTCAGGNQPCTTGLQGACSVGHTDCAADGEMPVCRPVIQQSKETCDNVDNDCDGVVDNGDGLCPDPTKPFCFQGACVGTCLGGEFPCPPGLTCDDSGHCADPACAAITCKAGTACRNGACVDPCDGVVCPYGTQCELGTCVDACAGVTCPADRVCEKGLCLSNCSCRGCGVDESCGGDGRCVDTACAAVMCAAGSVCIKGQCTDKCQGVVCPGGGKCSQGICLAAMPGSENGTGGGGTSVNFGGGPSGINFSAGTGNGSGGAGSGFARGKGPTSTSSCSCRIAGASGDGYSKIAWLSSLLGVAFMIRRRRNARAKAA